MGDIEGSGAHSVAGEPPLTRQIDAGCGGQGPDEIACIDERPSS